VLPIKTTIEDIEKISGYLRTQVGWTPLDRLRGSLESKYGDNRKIEALRFIGIIERDGQNVKLSEAGRTYATSADAAAKEQVLRDAIRTVTLYVRTVEWMHFSQKATATRTDVGVLWHDRHNGLLEGAHGAALTDAVVFFLRLAGAAGLGQYVAAGNNRPETLLKVDAAAVEAFATTVMPEANPPDSDTDAEVLPPAAAPPPGVLTPPASQPANAGTLAVATSPAIHVNIEIHIAADATAKTVEEIFKNMRRYVLSDPDKTTGDGK
jgi:hypothetical protein